MPAYPRDRRDMVPFLHIDSSPPQTPWRTKAREFQRRSSLVKRVAFLAILCAFAISIWLITYHGQEEVLDVEDRPPAPSPAVHAQRPQNPHHHAVPKPQTSSDAAPADVAHESQAEVEPVTFSLLIWSEDSASEGVILIKVMLYLYAIIAATDQIAVHTHVRVYTDTRTHHL